VSFHYRCAHLLILGAWVAQWAVAEPVYLRQGDEVGQGYTFRSGNACFAITANHVLSSDDAVVVMDQNKNRATAKIRKRAQYLAAGAEQTTEDDAAILELAPGSSVACTARWSRQEGKARADVDPSTPVRALRVFENGSVRQQRLLFRETRDHAMVLVPYGKTDEFQKGDSGTFLVADVGPSGGYLYAMITAVESDGNVIALSHAWIDSLFHELLTEQIKLQPLSILVNPILFNNRPIAAAPAVLFEELRRISGLDPTLAGATSVTQYDFAVGGQVLTAQPTLQRNNCERSGTQIKLFCLFGNQPTAPYVASVPVRVDFRVTRQADGRVMPYLFEANYNLAVQQQQEAQDEALMLAIQEGTLEALHFAGVLDAETASKVNGSKEKQVTYRVNQQTQEAMAGINSRRAISPELSGATSSPAPGQNIDGNWRGAYSCAIGKVGLELTLASAPGADSAGRVPISGVFRFFPLPENPGVSAGRYEVSGTYAAGSVVVAGQRWIAQPRGYVMVGLNGRIDGIGMAGAVIGGGCSRFELHRQSAAQTPGR
jgi:hypothetical protein